MQLKVVEELLAQQMLQGNMLYHFMVSLLPVLLLL